MASVSGFDPLCSAIKTSIGMSQTVDLLSNGAPRKSTFYRRIKSKFKLYLGKQRLPHPGIFATEENQDLALKAIALARINPNATIFLAAGENQYASAFLDASESIRNRIVLCLHQPPSYLKLHWKNFHAFNGLKAIVCLSLEQKKYIQAISDTPVINILHGVSTDFFRPNPNSARGKGRILFVGQWLRDFTLLHESIRKLHESGADFTLDCVVTQPTRHLDPILKLSRYLNVSWHSGLSAEELRQMYWNSNVLFQPLIDATANNAVVEAMSCGIPIVATDIGGLNQYVDQTCGYLCKSGDSEDHAKGLSRYILDTDAAIRDGENARQFAINNLSWPTIASQLMDLFPA